MVNLVDMHPQSLVPFRIVVAVWGSLIRSSGEWQLFVNESSV